jgi:RHS repeat-associated protein
MKRILGLFGFISIAIIFTAINVFAGEKVFFYHTDPAGTPLAMTDSNGTVVWRADYRPFGEEQSIMGSGDNDRRFVGKEKDTETGLQYFGARYMKDEIGRFITVDPVGPVDPRTSKTNYSMLTNPQRLNRYAYSLNNPYRYIDPDGRQTMMLVESPMGPVLIPVYVPTSTQQLTPKEQTDVVHGIISLINPITAFQNARDWWNYYANEAKGGGEETNPFTGPVDRPVTVVDPAGNAIPVDRGEQVTGSPDGRWIQVRDDKGNATGKRLDGPHKPASHPDERAQKPHAHVPGVVNPDGTPWLPAK